MATHPNLRSCHDVRALRDLIHALRRRHRLRFLGLRFLRRVSPWFNENFWPHVKANLLVHDRFREDHFVFDEDNNEVGGRRGAPAGRCVCGLACLEVVQDVACAAPVEERTPARPHSGVAPSRGHRSDRRVRGVTTSTTQNPPVGAVGWPQSKRRMAGVVASTTFVIATASMVALALYNYFEFNFQYAEALVPKDEKLVSTIKVSFELNVEFVGFAGCINASADTTPNGYHDHAFTITDTGLTCVVSRASQRLYACCVFLVVWGSESSGMLSTGRRARSPVGLSKASERLNELRARARQLPRYEMSKRTQRCLCVGETGPQVPAIKADDNQHAYMGSLFCVWSVVVTPWRVRTHPALNHYK